MPDTLPVGQREIGPGEPGSFSVEEQTLIMETVGPLLQEVINASGKQDIITALGELSSLVSKGLEANAEAKKNQPAA